MHKKVKSAAQLLSENVWIVYFSNNEQYLKKVRFLSFASILMVSRFFIIQLTFYTVCFSI